MIGLFSSLGARQPWERAGGAGQGNDQGIEGTDRLLLASRLSRVTGDAEQGSGKEREDGGNMDFISLLPRRG